MSKLFLQSQVSQSCYIERNIDKKLDDTNSSGEKREEVQIIFLKLQMYEELAVEEKLDVCL